MASIPRPNLGRALVSVWVAACACSGEGGRAPPIDNGCNASLGDCLGSPGRSAGTNPRRPVDAGTRAPGAGTGTGVGQGGAGTSGTGTGTAGAGAEFGTGTGVGGVGTSAGAANCTTDPIFGVTLCLSTPSCPTFSIDPGLFPNCGFDLVAGSTVAECVCAGNQLCPLASGVACSNLAATFSQQTIAQVCNQIGTGNCRSLEPGTPARACDPGCVSACANAPACITACGC